jgi:hypothetical protein
MPWGEVHRLTLRLLTDPSSHVAAAVREWAHPIERGDMVLRDLFDLQHRSKAKRKPEPYPRPWHPQPKRMGGGVRLTAGQFQAIKQAIADQN